MLTFVATGVLLGCFSPNTASKFDARWNDSIPVYSPSLGFLSIHIGKREERLFSDDPPEGVMYYESYEVFTSDGVRIRSVPASYYEPQLIPLPPGNYVVVLKSEKQNRTVGIQIDAGKTTIVEHLLQ